MFHEVKIFDKTGKIKKVFPSKKLSKEYWNTFFEMGKPTKNKGKKGGKKSPRLSIMTMKTFLPIFKMRIAVSYLRSNL